MFLAAQRAFVNAAGMTRDGCTNRDALCIIWVEPWNGRCTKHTQNGNIHRDTNVHGAGVRRDEEDAAAEQSGEHAEADLPGEDMQPRVLPLTHLYSTGIDDLHVHRSTHDGNVIATHEICIRNDSEVIRYPALRHPARSNVERNHLVFRGKTLFPKALRRLLCTWRKPHLEPGIIKLSNNPSGTQSRIV